MWVVVLVVMKVNAEHGGAPMARGTDENRGAYLRDIMEAIRELRGVADEDLAAPRG